jgi:uncharacterized protein (TIGR02646 family)
VIKVKRLPKPEVLAKMAERWRESLHAAGTAAARKRAEAKYRHREVKDSLAEMFKGKCAYCESKITHVDYGNIEHFRPKRGPHGRPDLAFEWNNMLLACGVCNGAQHKSDQFPSANEGGPLVNPCEDDPEVHFDFHYDRVSRLASVYGTTSRGATTERILGLNRVALREYRSTRVRHLIALARFAGTDPEAAKLIEEAKQSVAEYAAFARRLFP